MGFKLQKKREFTFLCCYASRFLKHWMWVPVKLWLRTILRLCRITVVSWFATAVGSSIDKDVAASDICFDVGSDRKLGTSKEPAGTLVSRMAGHTAQLGPSRHKRTCRHSIDSPVFGA